MDNANNPSAISRIDEPQAILREMPERLPRA
jgi:hypothetical protein